MNIPPSFKENGEPASSRRETLSIGVSVVLFRTPVYKITPLIDQFLRQRIHTVYLVDNSEPGFDAFANWSPPPQVVTISTRKNLGYGRANNIAIRDSMRRHKYHIVCNPDVTLGEGLIEDLHNLMESRPDVGLCAPRVLSPDGSLQYLCKRDPKFLDLFIRRFTPEHWFQRRRARYEMRDHSYESEMAPEFVSGCFMYFRNDTLRRLDGFDERFFLYLEDADLSRRVRPLAGLLYFPNNHIVHVHERGAHKSFRLLLHFGASVVRYFAKWGWKSSRHS